MTLAEELSALYSSRGAATYFGEEVTTLEHSLQTAHFAQLSAAPDALVLAALLHDIGHLLGFAADDMAARHKDARHEVSGGRWLAARFGAEVAEPVRLHVPTKRYLCAIEACYIGRLSEASVQTLSLQALKRAFAPVFQPSIRPERLSIGKEWPFRPPFPYFLHGGQSCAPKIRGRNMQWELTHHLKTAAMSVGLLALGTVFMQSVNAGCLQYEAPKRTVSWQTPDAYFGEARFIKANFSKDDDDYGSAFFRPGITGLWQFKYISKGNAKTLNIPDGAPIDGGNTMFFADGNEMTYSGMRDPTTGAVCLGVWKQTGEHSYVLNHIGLSWNPPGNAQGLPAGPGGPAFIKQFITLDRSGNHYSGTFTINQLGPDGKSPALPAPIKGLILATRITVSTDTEEP
jgi:predicted HD phosphohydrolase